MPRLYSVGAGLRSGDYGGEFTPAGDPVPAAGSNGSSQSWFHGTPADSGGEFNIKAPATFATFLQTNQTLLLSAAGGLFLLAMFSGRGGRR